MVIEPEREDQEMEMALKLHRRHITAFGLDLHTLAVWFPAFGRGMGT